MPSASSIIALSTDTDSLCYLDLLLKDLGLNIWRKKNRFWELFQPYNTKNCEGLVTEWMQMQNRGVGKVT